MKDGLPASVRGVGGRVGRRRSQPRSAGAPAATAGGDDSDPAGTRRLRRLGSGPAGARSGLSLPGTRRAGLALGSPYRWRPATSVCVFSVSSGIAGDGQVLSGHDPVGGAEPIAAAFRALSFLPFGPGLSCDRLDRRGLGRRAVAAVRRRPGMAAGRDSRADPGRPGDDGNGGVVPDFAGGHRPRPGRAVALQAGVLDLCPGDRGPGCRIRLVGYRLDGGGGGSRCLRTRAVHAADWRRAAPYPEHADSCPARMGGDRLAGGAGDSGSPAGLQSGIRLPVRSQRDGPGPWGARRLRLHGPAGSRLQPVHGSHVRAGTVAGGPPRIRRARPGGSQRSPVPSRRPWRDRRKGWWPLRPPGWRR